jgi:hypothetical protein
MQGQLAQAQQHGLGLRQRVAINGTPLLFQREQVLRSWLGHHPLSPRHNGNLEGCAKYSRE